jgi:hypothetical protein
MGAEIGVRLGQTPIIYSSWIKDVVGMVVEWIGVWFYATW